MDIVNYLFTGNTNKTVRRSSRTVPGGFKSKSRSKSIPKNSKMSGMIIPNSSFDIISKNEMNTSIDLYCDLLEENYRGSLSARIFSNLEIDGPYIKDSINHELLRRHYIQLQLGEKPMLSLKNIKDIYTKLETNQKITQEIGAPGFRSFTRYRPSYLRENDDLWDRSLDERM